MVETLGMHVVDARNRTLRPGPKRRRRTIDDMSGDADLAHVGALLAEPARCRILLALADGRALPASTLAREARVASSTASGHLARLLDAGFLGVEQHGRHRYYRFAGPHVAELVEAIARVAPPSPVRSLSDDRRGVALRRARTCYDHLAGRLGVELLAACARRRFVAGHDGSYRAGVDRLSAPGRDVVYRLTATGIDGFARVGVDVDGWSTETPVRHCMDWTEQRHHLAGDVGRRIARRVEELGWITRQRAGRAVVLTDAGVTGLADSFGVELSANA